MVTSYIDIDGKWGVLISYDFDMLDWDAISAVRRPFGLDDRMIHRALRVLSTPNSGLSVSNDDIRMTAIYIGKSTSTAQFWNSVAHELKHAADAIIDYYGEPLDGESSAYTIGYLMQRVVEEIAIPCK
mgnify:CR=1 FL=1